VGGGVTSAVCSVSRMTQWVLQVWHVINAPLIKCPFDPLPAYALSCKVAMDTYSDGKEYVEP